MNYRYIVQTLGKTALIEAAALLSALFVAIYYNEDSAPAFIYSILILLCIGAPMARVRTVEKVVRPIDGFVVVSLCWISLSLLGALPFVFSGAIPSFTDAVFETASGLTTTGASILRNVEELGRGELYWRSLTNWIGGMGVIVLLMTLTSRGGKGALHVLRAEVPGPTVDKILPKMRETALMLYKMYIVLSVLEFSALWIAGLGVYESLVLTFANAGTGGFAVKTLSVGAYGPVVQWIVGIFMVLFSLNFSVYFFMALGKFKKAFAIEEVRAIIGIVAVSVALITLNIAPMYANAFDAMRDAFFQTGTIISTSGFATADFNLWPIFSKSMIIILMFIGGCSGSTAGGLKVSRLLILFKAIKVRVMKLVNSQSYKVVTLDGNLVDNVVVHNTLVYFVIYMFLQIVSFLLLSIENHDILTTSTAVISCFNNIGPGLGEVGPMGNYAFFSDPGKWLLILNMLLGRLEIYPLIVFFGYTAHGLKKKL